MKTLIEQVSFWGSVIASLLMAANIPISGWAYVLFLVSNLAMFFLFKIEPTPKVIIYQNYYFVVINLIGITRWLL